MSTNFENLLNIIINDDIETKNKLLESVKKISNDDKLYIEEKSLEIINLDKEIDNNLNPRLYKLQVNVLLIFMKASIPNCREPVKKLLDKFNKRIEVINQILKK
jgi:hypothetical protein